MVLCLEGKLTGLPGSFIDRKSDAYYYQIRIHKEKRENLKVLHLERKFTSNTETFIVNQINALPQYEQSVFTIDFIDALPSIADVYSPQTTPFLSDKILRKSQISYFKNQLSVIKPDLIHSHFITDACVFHKVTKNLKIPKICSCYGYDVSVIPIKFRYFYKFFYKAIIDEYDLFLAMTAEMKNDLLNMGFPEDKIKVHYHGIDTSRFKVKRDYLLKDNVLQLLTIASLLPVKGHMSVLKALKWLRDSTHEIQFEYNIVGAGPLKASLEDYVKKNGMTNMVFLKGMTKHGEEFNKYLSKADVFLHPSITTLQNAKEGIPGAVVEAMASGLPVVSSWHGGIPSVIEDGATGFLVQENDSQDIADKILLFYNDQGLRQHIGERARAFAHKNLDLFEKAKDLEKIYRDFI